MSFALRPRVGEAFKEIDLNADAGEGYDDAALMKSPPSSAFSPDRLASKFFVADSLLLLANRANSESTR